MQNSEKNYKCIFHFLSLLACFAWLPSALSQYQYHLVPFLSFCISIWIRKYGTGTQLAPTYVKQLPVVQLSITGEHSIVWGSSG